MSSELRYCVDWQVLTGVSGACCVDWQVVTGVCQKLAVSVFRVALLHRFLGLMLPDCCVREGHMQIAVWSHYTSR